jgi:hypothetical protein
VVIESSCAVAVTGTSGCQFAKGQAKSGEYITQVTTIGLLALEYFDAGDDPRDQAASKKFRGSEKSSP